MPKGSRGGRGVASGSRAGGAGGGFYIRNGAATPTGVKMNPLMTKSQVDDLQEESQDHVDDVAETDINVIYALKQWISSARQANGRSISQNLNEKLETGQKLNLNEKSIEKGLDKAMIPVGQPIQYIRADHALTPNSNGTGVMERLGLQNYQNMTESQLQAAAVGKSYTVKGYTAVTVATQANKNVFLNGNQAGGRSVIVHMNAGAGQKYVAGDANQGEHILARNTSYTVTAIRYTGAYAYPASGGRLKQVEIWVDAR